MNEHLLANHLNHPLIGASILRLRMQAPFFGTLAMFARFVASETIPTLATDGRDIFFNPEFLRTLSSQERDGALLHELLHAALLHPLRMRERQPQLWNIAADIVVNGTLWQQGFVLPLGGLRDEQLEHLSVEEAYELLQLQDVTRFDLTDADLLSVSDRVGECDRTIATYWQQALQQATIVSNSTPSQLPRGIAREIQSIADAQLDWRAYLWRYLAQTQTDFQGFDRRFVGTGLYLEGLQNESANVLLAIDTSGSIQQHQLELFLGEVRGILAVYPQIECQLYYADDCLSAPYQLTTNTQLPIPEGGGGTSFVPFFDHVREIVDGYTPTVCIYLTDGYGEFPTIVPPIPTLWVVSVGGLDLAAFPFGEAVRLFRD